MQNTLTESAIRENASKTTATLNVTRPNRPFHLFGLEGVSFEHAYFDYPDCSSLRGIERAGKLIQCWATG